MSESNYLYMHNISKSFPGVKALSNVDLEVRQGEVHALLGENGAGKSTLLKILSGAYTKDEGEIFVNGKKIEQMTTKLAEELGISVIYQEFNNLPHLSSQSEKICTIRKIEFEKGKKRYGTLYSAFTYSNTKCLGKSRKSFRRKSAESGFK